MNSKLKKMKRIFISVLFAGIYLISFAQFDKETMDSLRRLTEMDYQYMLHELQINHVRPGADGNNPSAPNAANYDESRANPYPLLPDPLIMKNGERVVTPEMWQQKRRPEILEDFDREIYGRIPENVPSVHWTITGTIHDTLDGIPSIKKSLVGTVDNSAYPAIQVQIKAELYIPKALKKPVPVMLEFGFILSPERINIMRQNEKMRQYIPDWPGKILAKGWGYAVLDPVSIQADNGAGLTQGIIGLTNKSQFRKPDDWGALRAWAWGASRLLDYFGSDPDVDAQKVGIAGHSRYGKAALVAMAYDQRFAIVYCSSSGEGGAKLHRRNIGEIVENLANPGEYHWMAGNFIRYAGPLTWNDLPVDSHELIALCAPRPVFIGCGSLGERWVDPKGMFMAAVAAGPVYELMGKKGLETSEFPPVMTALTSGDIAFYQHDQGHTPAPGWPVFLSYAKRYFEK